MRPCPGPAAGLCSAVDLESLGPALGHEPDLRIEVRPGPRGNEILLRLSAPGDPPALARLAALLAAGVAPFASWVELAAAGTDAAEMRFIADKRELSKWAMGALRRQALLSLLSAAR